MKFVLSVLLIFLSAQQAAYSASAGDRALAWAKAQRDTALNAVVAARIRVDAAESDLRISRNVESDIRGSKDEAALPVANEAVAISELGMQEAHLLLKKALNFLEQQDRTLTAVRDTVAKSGSNRAILIPGQGDVRCFYESGNFHPDAALPLRAGTRVEVGKGGSAHLFVAGGDAEIALSQNTSFTVTRDDEVDGFEATLERGFGRLRWLIKGKLAHRFEVRTSGGTASVRGTDFSVNVLPNGSRFEVFEGVVNVQPPNGGDPVDVHAGEGCEVVIGEGIRIYPIPPQQMREHPWNDRPVSN